ncbi:DUF2911 domain-containing protein [Croceiramulus getboli]|nr:DUF2911 domain-containing protein [Flavobacteriaceae bacterium YJPT1-3]
MKNVFIALIAFAFCGTAQAQIVTPQPSPKAEMEQTIGLTDVKLEYSRPAMRGRTIFGDLVPFDQMWRMGANENTKITFSEDVMIGGSEVKAGTYAVYAKPSAAEWDVIFYSDATNWGLPQEWDESKVVATATVPTQDMPMDIESFTITFDDVTMNGANMGILWENTYVGVPIQVMTDKAVMASIDRTLSGPAASDYYAAAVYYLSADKDINKAKEYMDKAMSMIDNPRYWQLRQQSLILAKAGDKKGAIKAAKASLAAAQEADNMDYVKMNKDSLKEWGAM